MFDIGALLAGLGGQIGQLEGIQGPPQANGMLPKRTAPVGGSDLLSKGGGFDMAGLAPIIQGLMGGLNTKEEGLSPPPAGHIQLGGGRAIQPTAFPQFNPASIRNRM